MVFLRFNKIVFRLVLPFCLFSMVWAGPLPQVSSGAQQAAQEYELKAVYLYNFLQFVQWPESRRTLPKDGPVVVCIIGESPFGEALEALQANVRKSGMRPVRVINYGAYQEDMNIAACHLLFVTSSEKKNFRKIITGLRDAPVLTVADTENFLSSGGMINLVHSNGKIRWTINRSAADRAGLRLSAQLLSIAVKVIEAP